MGNERVGEQRGGVVVLREAAAFVLDALLSGSLSQANRKRTLARPLHEQMVRGAR